MTVRVSSFVLMRCRTRYVFLHVNRAVTYIPGSHAPAWEPIKGRNRLIVHKGICLYSNEKQITSLCAKIQAQTLAMTDGIFSFLQMRCRTRYVFLHVNRAVTYIPGSHAPVWEPIEGYDRPIVREGICLYNE